MAEHLYVALAREAIRTFVEKTEILPSPSLLPQDMERRAAAFVSIKKKKELRGCIGTYSPTRKNLAQEIIHNAISAATRDPRFPPVSPEELDELEISVDVLGPLIPVRNPTELDPRRYGIMVCRERRRGLLLPALEGVDTAAQQLEIARRKAGIRPQEPVEILKFEVVRYGP